MLLDLADELGFWVIDECDLEAHGFRADGWVGNPPTIRTGVRCTSTGRTAWSSATRTTPASSPGRLGNESGPGSNLAAMAAWIHRRDPGRPVHYENDHSDRRRHRVACTRQVEELVHLTKTRPGRPIIECEYVHAMGNGAGGIATYEATFDAHPALHGGFVARVARPWHPHHGPSGTPFHAYGGDFGEALSRQELRVRRHVLADGAAVAHARRVRGRRDADQAHLPRRGVTVETGATTPTPATSPSVVHEIGGNAAASGSLTVPPVARRGHGDRAAAALDLTAPGEELAHRHRRPLLAGPDAVGPAGHVVTIGQLALRSVPSGSEGATGGVEFHRTGDGFALGDARSRPLPGTISCHRGRSGAGRRGDAVATPTENDSLATRGSYELADPADTMGLGVDGPSSAERWREAGSELPCRITLVDVATAGPGEPRHPPPPGGGELRQA